MAFDSLLHVNECAGVKIHTLFGRWKTFLNYYLNAILVQTMERNRVFLSGVSTSNLNRVFDIDVFVQRQRLTYLPKQYAIREDNESID